MSAFSSALGPAPTSLLRALLRPSLSASPPPFVQTQVRKASKVTLLDKLHRKQRKAVRQERLDSITRANAMPSPTTSSPSTPPTAASQPATISHLNPSIDPSTVATTTKATLSPSATPSTPASQTPYTITRTPSQQLPIYHLSKAGGNKHLTKLRKIDGDLSQLKSDVRAALGVEEYVTDRMGRKKENVAVNWTTRQIVVRGWRKPELVKWAEGMGF